jgi:hypothetical protein
MRYEYKLLIHRIYRFHISLIIGIALMLQTLKKVMSRKKNIIILYDLCINEDIVSFAMTRQTKRVILFIIVSGSKIRFANEFIYLDSCALQYPCKAAYYQCNTVKYSWHK